VTSTTPPRPRRADARRNFDALISVAKQVFAQSGADAPLDEITRRAGVGFGTLYRHFPTREHLFVEIMRERVDLLTDRARELLDSPGEWSALVEWLRLYDRSAAEYRGMSMRVAESLADDASPVAAACAPMKEAFADLFARAVEAGAVRTDLTALQLLTLVSALPKDATTGLTVEPALDVILRGIRR
jgi:AcrR family transcriptional regulator